MELLGKILLVFFLLMGVAYTCRTLLWWLLRAENPERMVITVPLRGHVEDAEHLLRNAADVCRESNGKEVRLICVDGGMDEETYEICRCMQREMPFLEICTASELTETLFRQE